MESTDPVDVPVVDAANNPDAAGPNLASLPSMLPPAWVALTVWVTPARSSLLFPLASSGITMTDAASQSTNIALSTAMPCFTSPAILPNVQVNANGIASSVQI